MSEYVGGIRTYSVEMKEIYRRIVALQNQQPYQISQYFICSVTCHAVESRSDEDDYCGEQNDSAYHCFLPV